ncbi:bifunctional YncE family protein/alkaline phosphatase family protein [Armatimonas rosea]|uniref:DNA-binding beta-propeller fold protein YncE n=1 Tax=Armatimonas rosea TaxID=685828 RepID=A0A7W9W7M1_ARMRO|nr:bifunctional YncE family protein/alkaline phosphatase family protein [Armatimonas rosea]MBB6051361.1 DNA-binding beta-propeller fold protein YncE [Armatimonas rosea]
MISKRTLALSGALILGTSTALVARQRLDILKGGSLRLAATGWTISPVGSAHATMGDTLLSAALRPDGQLLAVTNGGGAAHGVSLIDTATGALKQQVKFGRTHAGLVWSPDGGTLFICGGNSGLIQVLTKQADGSYAPGAPLTVLDTKPIAAGTKKAKRQSGVYLGGITLAPSGKRLYAADLTSDTIVALNTDGTEKIERELEDGARPGALRPTADGKYLLCALWGKAQVLVLDAATLETKRTLKVGAHPNDLLLASDGRLFVSCGNDDSVYVFDFANLDVSASVRDEDSPQLEKIVTRLPQQSSPGATPSSLALSPDEKTLYVACSDINAVAVIATERRGGSKVAGFIPTAHYPTTVTVSSDGKKLFIGSSKGVGTGANPSEKPDPEYARGFSYILSLLSGVVSTVPTPDAKQLADHTRKCLANVPKVREPKPGSSAIPSKLGERSPIEHVLYIIKENRTYDQVLGDLGKGNGDKSLCLFGEDVTPNHHALAREYVTLDNLYCSGEVSVDGHHWSNAGIVPDFMQRTWPAQYGGKGAPPLNGGDSGDPLSMTPSGKIWDACQRAGVSYRTYYYHTKKNQSEEWAAARAKGERDSKAADIFIRELAEFEKNNNLPKFMVMALSEDHTRGATAGAFTPKASVASNDQGIGKIVEACSKSKYWSKLAIFIIEDDAQNGPDHVDAHRTVGLVVSPYTRLGRVDSTFYTTCSFLRSMELILNVPPLSVFDASATPLWASFGTKPDTTPYTCRPPKIDLNAKNPGGTSEAKESAELDLDEPDHLDQAEEQTLNKVIWESVKGKGVPYPGPTHRFLGMSTASPQAPRGY